MLAALTSRETDCYSWHDSMVRHTLVDTARSKAKTSALGSLSPETKLPVNLRLIVLCGVESFPGADGLLSDQRSYRTIRPDHVRPLLFQDYINPICQFARHGDDCFARGYLLWVSLINTAIESPQFRVSLDRRPSALNQFVAQATVAGASNLTAILFIAGGVFARDYSQKAGYLSPVFYLPGIAQAGHQMRAYNPADARQTQQQIDRLLQLWIIQAVLADLFSCPRGRLKMKVQRVQQVIELKAHRVRARQRLQLAHSPRRPLLMRVGKRNPFVEQQRLNPELTGGQLPDVRVPYLHQMAQVAIPGTRHMNAVQLSAPQTLRQLAAVESIGLHAFARRPRHFRGRHHQASISSSHKLVVQTKASRAGFVGKGHPLAGKMLAHVVHQRRALMGYAQRTLRTRAISENYRHPLFVNIESPKHVVIARDKPRHLNLNCHRRCSELRLLMRPYLKQPT